APGVFAGERVRLTIRREGKPRDVFIPLVDGPTLYPGVWRDARWSVRRSGFPDVFCHDGGIAPDQCGGPVVDRAGQLIGVNIARANPVQTFAIPADVVRQTVEQLRRQLPR